MHRRLERLRSAILAVAAAWVLAAPLGCAHIGEYVWFRQLPPEADHAASEYVIGVGDVLSIRVLGHDEMTIKERVRADGRVALFLIGEVEARGKRPSALKAELEGRLKDYIVTPSVVVNVDEARPVTVVILGEVAHPGPVQLDSDRRLSRALATVGGLTEFASHTGIFVVRARPTRTRIRFDYEDVLRDAAGAGDFPLRQGDLIEVE